MSTTYPGLRDPYGVATTIADVAQALGVDPALAIADAEYESSLNPTVVVMDHHADGSPAGYSVGLYQLNQGGELQDVPGATLADKIRAAQDPATNARVALAQFAAVMRANPGITDPGQIAAAAERPANPSAYAQAVDQRYQQLTGAQPSTGSIGPSPATAPPATATLTSLPNPFNIPSDIVHGLYTAVFLAAGAGLVALGAWRLAAPTVKKTTEEAGKAATLAAAAA